MLDKTSCLFMAVIMAGMFAYFQFVSLPAKEKYFKDLERWCLEHPEEAAQDKDCISIGVAPVGSGSLAPVGSGSLAPVGSGSLAPIGSGSLAPVGSAATAPVVTSSVARVDSGDAPTAWRPEATSPVGGPAVAENPRDDGIVFDTSEHHILLSTRGGSVRYLTLKNVLGSTYKPKQTSEDDAADPVPFQILHPYVEGVNSFAVEPRGEGLEEAARRDWKHEAIEGGGHRFSLLLPNGILLTKTYTPPKLPDPPTSADSDDDDAEAPRLFHFDLKVTATNTGEAEQSFDYWLYGAAGVVVQEVGRSSYGQEYVLASLSKDGRKVHLQMDPVRGFENLKSDKDGPDKTVDLKEGRSVRYYGTSTKYFAAVVVPQEGTQLATANSMGLIQYGKNRQPGKAEKEGDDAVGKQSLPRGLVEAFTLAPGEAKSQEFMIYVGPRQDSSIFEQPVYAHEKLDELVYYGWGIFGTFAHFLMWFLGGLHAVVGNWGVAILLLTVMVRGAMLPLSMWSQKNMLRMQTLAPEINKLKEKYSKKDGSMSPEQQRAFQQAQMELWRAHNVNPVGCIGPIFLQMPIFIGLYNSLNYSVAMRHSEFAFWIKDLSIPDVAARLPFTIPILGTNALSILPLLMVCTYVLQQRIQPKPADEKAAEQQKIMKMVMPMFGFLFYTMPSGLLLYFMTSSLWSIAEQLTIKKKIKEQEEARRGDGASSGDEAKGKKQKKGGKAQGA